MQVHLDNVPSLDVDRLKERCDAVAQTTPGVLGFRAEEGEDQGRYLNLVFGTYEPLAAWPVVREALYESHDFGGDLRNASMALCTGDQGWDDYKLLYHFDRSVPLDVADEA